MKIIPVNIPGKIDYEKNHNSFKPPGIVDKNARCFDGVPAFNKGPQGHCDREYNEQDCHNPCRENDRCYFILHLREF